jgi:hypothetical protein
MEFFEDLLVLKGRAEWDLLVARGLQSWNEREGGAGAEDGDWQRACSELGASGGDLRGVIPP